MSYADEFARLEEFLQADPDYARFDAECSRLKVIVDRQARIAGESERDYEAFSLCQETLEYAIHDIPDFSPDNLALFNGELAACQLDRGAKRFERLRRECMIKGGEASRAWQEATDHLADVKHERQERRYVLVDAWHEIEANKKAADQEAK